MIDKTIFFPIFEIMIGLYFFYKLKQKKEIYYLFAGFIFLGIGLTSLLYKINNNIKIYEYLFGSLEIVIGIICLYLFQKNKKKYENLFLSICVFIFGIERILSEIISKDYFVFEPIFWSAVHIFASMFFFNSYKKQKNEFYLLAGFFLIITGLSLNSLFCFK